MEGVLVEQSRRLGRTTLPAPVLLVLKSCEQLRGNCESLLYPIREDVALNVA
jgi:hypothetical protein